MSLFDDLAKKYKEFWDETAEKYCNKFIVRTDCNEPFYLGKVLNIVDIHYDRVVIEIEGPKYDDDGYITDGYRSTINMAIWQLQEAMVFDTREEAELFCKMNDF